MQKLTEKAGANVLFLGGSITAGAGASFGNGYASQLGNWLRDTYGANYAIQAIGGTGSNLASARVSSFMETTIPDLVFIEYAVNDAANDVGDTNYTHFMRHTEGIVRQILTKNPNADIVFINTLHVGNMAEDYETGELPPSIIAKNVVADHYDLGSVNVGKQAVVNVLNDNTKNWYTYLNDGSCHPNDTGATLYADIMKKYITDAINNYDPEKVREVIPDDACSDGGYYIGRMVPMSDDYVTNGTWLHDGNHSYVDGEEGTVSFTFEGDCVGIFISSSSNYRANYAYTLDGTMSGEITNTSHYALFEKNTVLGSGEHTLNLTAKSVGENYRTGLSHFLVWNLIQ